LHIPEHLGKHRHQQFVAKLAQVIIIGIAQSAILAAVAAAVAA